MLSREEFEDIAARLATLSFARELVLIGSAALYRLLEDVPPMTEDVDVLLPEELLVHEEETVRRELERIGFRQAGRTATWVDPAGLSLDLVGSSSTDTLDRAGGTLQTPVMVFNDLNLILSEPAGAGRLAGRPDSLSAAGLALSKLLTLRLDKGLKDRLHALLLLARQPEDSAFDAGFLALLDRFGTECVEELFPEAQAAFIAAGGTSEATPWFREYASRMGDLRLGLQRLGRILGKGGEP